MKKTYEQLLAELGEAERIIMLGDKLIDSIYGAWLSDNQTDISLQGDALQEFKHAVDKHYHRPRSTEQIIKDAENG